MSHQNRQVIDLSIMSIVKFFFVVLILIFLWIIKEVLAILFVALILAAAFDPWVDGLEKIRFPRWLSILLIYIVIIAVFTLSIYLVIPPIVEQSAQLAENFPQYLDRATNYFNHAKTFFEEKGYLSQLNEGLASLSNTLSSSVDSVFSTVVGIFGGIVSLFVILVITFYMTVEEGNMKRTLTYVLPEKYQPFTLQLINKVQRKIGAWLKGQLILSLIIGVMSYVGLMILGVNYALVLALICAVGEFIPYLGPALSSIPAIFLAFTQSPLKALLVLCLYIVIQQMENHLLVPKVMQKAVGLNPIISIVALLIGVKIGGFVGILLAIPVATAVSVIIREICMSKDEVEEISK